MMKIIHTIAGISKSSGGPSFFLKELLNEISKDINVISELFYYSSNNDISGIDKKVILNKQKNNIFNYIKLFILFFKKIEKKDNIIIHIHGLWQSHVVFSYLFCIKNKIRYIISPHGMLEPWSLSQNYFKKKIALFIYQRIIIKNAHYIHATSDMEANNIKNLGFKNPIIIIPNGINVDYYSFKSNYNKNNNFLFLFLSRIHIKKGIEILIDTFDKLKMNNKDIEFKLSIYGDGDPLYIKKIKNYIKEKNLTNIITVYDPIYDEKKLNEIKNADIFILPSFSENFGNVIAESLSCGTPVITTNTTPWEILNISNAGWCIDVGVNPLYNLLMEILTTDKNKLTIISKNSRNLALNNFSIKITANKHIQMYNWVLKINEQYE